MNFGANKPSGIKIEWLRGKNYLKIIDKKGYKKTQSRLVPVGEDGKVEIKDIFRIVTSIVYYYQNKTFEKKPVRYSKKYLI
jgi:hypothetical protein